MIDMAAVFIASFFVTLAAFYGLIPYARRVGYVDRPGGRKQHIGKTPLIGGLVILPVFAVLMVLLSLLTGDMAVLLTGVVVMFFMGAYDDLRQMNPWIKFFVQIAVAAFLVIVGGAEVYQFGNLFGFGDTGPGFLSIPFSIAALVLFMNALNMMDGMDGLAGGMAAVILGWLAFAAMTARQDTTLLQILCVLVPLLAFLCLNMRSPWLKKAQVFLGDAGSLSLAVIIGWFAIDLSQPPGRAIEPVGIIWLLALPVIDTLTLFFLRTRRGRHPFAPDRNHLHHRLLDKGIAPHYATSFLMLGAILCGSIGVQGPLIGLPPILLLVVWILTLFGYMGYSLRRGADRTFS